MNTSRENCIQSVMRAWNTFDPIGVVKDVETDTEYSSYVKYTTQLVLGGADAFKIRGYVIKCVNQNIGIAPPQERLDAFLSTLLSLREV